MKIPEKIVEYLYDGHNFHQNVRIDVPAGVLIHVIRTVQADALRHAARHWATSNDNGYLGLLAKAELLDPTTAPPKEQ